MTSADALRAELAGIVGQAHVLHGGDLSAWEQDWRKRSRGRALAVVRPGSTGEVAAVVRACAQAGTPLVPQGGNTGMVVGGIPDATGTQVVLSLGRMNRIRAIDADNLTVTAYHPHTGWRLSALWSSDHFTIEALHLGRNIRHTLQHGTAAEAEYALRDPEMLDLALRAARDLLADLGTIDLRTDTAA